jgi:hypothetical protein
VFDKVTITYRGAKYEIGRGRGFYGIWTAGASRSQPLEWWPETSEGWSAAWTRFAGIEAPGTIVPVGRRTAAVPSQGSAQVSAPLAGGTVPAGESAAQAGGSTALGGQPPGPAGQGTALLDERTAPVGAGGAVPGAWGAVPGAGGAPFDQGGAPFGARTAPPGNVRAGAIGAVVLLAAGVILGIAGLFPTYLAGASLASQAAEVVPHAIYLAVWTASAVLIVLGGVRLRLGALLGAGMSLVTFGLFFADAGTVISGGAHLGGWGLWLSLLGWLACAAGSVLAMVFSPARVTSLGRPRGAEFGPVVMLVLAGLGVAAAFAPAWDSYTLRTAAGQSQSLTAGNAFSNPGPVIAGDIAVMVALAAVVILAALWRPVRHGAVLLAGAAIPMAAQAISALVQAGGATSPTQFGITPAEATAIGLTIDSGLTPAFWIYCGFLVALVVSCAWMLFTPHQVPGSAPNVSAGAYAWNPAGPGTALGTTPGTVEATSVEPPMAAGRPDEDEDEDDG